MGPLMWPLMWSTSEQSGQVMWEPKDNQRKEAGTNKWGPWNDYWFKGRRSKDDR
jgi:hypothetical protein